MVKDATEFSFLEADAKRVERSTPLPQVTRGYVTAGSGRKVSFLQFVDPADSADPQIFFLHGAGLNAHTFDPTILAMERSVVSIDLPGHGRSDWREDAGYSPFLMASDVADAIAELSGGRPVHIVGHSLGGLTASQIAIERPELVKTLTLVDISPGIVPSRDAGSVSEFITGKRDFASIDEIVDRAIEFEIGHDRVALTRGVTLNTRLRGDGRYEWTHHLAHLSGLESTHTQAPEGTSIFESLWQPLKELGARAHLVQATTGMVSDEMVKEWRSEIPEAKVSVLEGGHNLHEHNPLGLAKLLNFV